MKKQLFSLLVLFIAAFSMTSCHSASPDAGQEVVLISQPWFFGHGGVIDEPITTGLTWCALSTDVVKVSIKPETHTEEFKDMIPADNTPVSFDVFLITKNVSGKTPYLIKNFGADWYNQNVKAAFRTMVRDKACVYTMFDLSNKREISAKIQAELKTDIINYIEKHKIPVEVVDVQVGAITPPKPVLDETKLTAAQNQSVLTQKARATSELARKQAEINKAIADKAYQNQMGMSINDYLHLRQLEIQKEKVELIKDHDNVTIIFGGEGGIPTTYPVK